MSENHSESTGCSEGDTEEQDSDGDTVNDSDDQCPQTAEGLSVDPDGCADEQKDDDGDGVNNAIDQCPDTAQGESVDETGEAGAAAPRPGLGEPGEHRDTIVTPRRRRSATGNRPRRDHIAEMVEGHLGHLANEMLEVGVRSLGRIVV